MPHPARMSPLDTALLVIDVQEKLMAKIPQADRLIGNIAFLIDAAKLVEMPVLATEQYPKGLGSTVAELAKRLPERPDKTGFSCCAVPSVEKTLREEGRPKVILAGIETHVCVLQSALDLISRDFRVFIPADAVSSRYLIDHDMGLRRMEANGAILVSSEMCVFEWLGGSHHPAFKQISQLVQQRMQSLSDRG